MKRNVSASGSSDLILNPELSGQIITDSVPEDFGSMRRCTKLCAYQANTQTVQEVTAMIESEPHH